MVASVKKKRDEMPINRDVLRWARERIQLSYDDAAEGAGVKPQQIEEWEFGPRVPTVRQARKLAQVYDRPFLEFFAKRRPTVKEPTLVPDFRMHREAESPKERHELVLIQSEAEEVRINALDLYELLGEQPPKLPDKIYAAQGDDAQHDSGSRPRDNRHSGRRATSSKGIGAGRFCQNPSQQNRGEGGTGCQEFWTAALRRSRNVHFRFSAPHNGILQ